MMTPSQKKSMPTTALPSMMLPLLFLFLSQCIFSRYGCYATAFVVSPPHYSRGVTTAFTTGGGTVGKRSVLLPPKKKKKLSLPIRHMVGSGFDDILPMEQGDGGGEKELPKKKQQEEEKKKDEVTWIASEEDDDKSNDDEEKMVVVEEEEEEDVTISTEVADPVATATSVPSEGVSPKEEDLSTKDIEEEEEVDVVSSSPTASSGDEVKEKKGDEEEWHPHDPASTTPQLLSSLWFMIAQGSDMVKGDEMTVIFPNLQSTFTPSYLNRLFGHLDVCKDVCDDFGITTVLVPYRGMSGLGKMVSGFTVKSYRDPNKKRGEDGEWEFDYDPLWDDGDVMDYSGVDDLYEESGPGGGTSGPKRDVFPDIVDKIPTDDDKLIDVTKNWVDKMMSDMGICPFTSGPDLSGMPMGKVYYTTDRASSMEDVYARYWKEVVRLEQMNEKDLSTTLLVLPEFCMDNVELFESFANTLTQPLEALNLETLIQLIFFHPQWTFRDGGERSGLGSAANYARRSPWPMINILRTKQVRTAQRGIPTGLVYQQNEKTLNRIGTEKLETMLRLRDWSPVADVKVDRKDLEALRVAQDLQSSGTVKEEDTSFVYDSTPAANKVDRRNVEGGDLIKVLMQALEKRLGEGDGGKGGSVEQLSGAETSAAMMASDVLLEELENLMSGKKTPSTPPAVPSQSAAAGGSGGTKKGNVAPAMFGGMGGMMMSDLDEDEVSPEDEEMSILFGGAGIMENKKDDDDVDLSEIMGMGGGGGVPPRRGGGGGGPGGF